MKQVSQTSKQAYKNMQPKIPSHHELILAVLSDEKELTYNEIAKSVRLWFYSNKKTIEAQAWLNPNKVSIRLAELIRLKKIIPGEIRKCTIGGRNCQTYLLNKAVK